MASRHAREVAQAAFIAVLVVTAIATGAQVENLTDSRDELRTEVADARTDARTNAAAVESIESILADVCAAAPDPQLDDAGVGRECTLAEAGNIEDRLPVVEPTTPPAAGPAVSVGQVEGVVDAYLRRYLADLPDDYVAELREQMVAYLRAHPGPPGDRGRRGPRGRAITQARVAAAAASYLTANPPPAGEPGVGVSSAFLDGCDVVFTYTDGASSRIGPLCGPAGDPGRPPTAEEVRAAVDAYCAARADGDCVGATGRGIAEMECVDANPDDAASRWRISYTDGTVDEDAGPCRGPQGPPGEPGPPGPSPTSEPSPTENPPPAGVGRGSP